MNRLLLTGINGFVGSHIARYALACTDWEIVGLDRMSSGRLDEHERLTILECNLAEETELAAWVERIGQIDYIINAAALADVAVSMADPVRTIETNVSAVLSVLELACALKPEIFLQISTNEVYGASNALHREWDAIVPGSPYSASKAAQEAIAIAYWRSYGVPVVIATTQNLFGQRQQPEKLIPTCIRKLQAGSLITLYPGVHYWLHAANFADALLFLIARGAASFQRPDDRPDRYNICGELELDNQRVAELVADTMGLPLRYEPRESTRPGHDARYCLDGSKLAGLGWTPPVKVKQAIADTVRWTVANPQWL